jgi:hypothetical protein
MESPTHFWRFKDQDDLYNRYNQIINITDLKTVDVGYNRCKVIGRGVIL